MGNLVLLLLVATCAPAGDAPRYGDVLLVAGEGDACPNEVLAEGALVLRLDGAALPEPLAQLPTLELTSTGDRPERADLAHVRGARALHLVGDRGIAWWKVMYRGGKGSALQRAVLAGQARGADLVGWRAGAMYLAGAWFAPAEDLEAGGYRTRNPRRAEQAERVVGGLGLAPGGLLVFGDEVDARARVLSALHRRRAWVALVLEGELCWRWDPQERRVELAGPGRALLFEMDGSRRTKTGFDQAALSVLGEGDAWDLARGRIELARAGEVGPADLEALSAGSRMARAPLRVVGLPRWPQGVRDGR